MRAASIVLLTGLLALVAGAPARAQFTTYTTCPLAGDADIVEVSGAACEDVTGAVAALVAAAPGDAATVLRNAGWTPVRAQATSDEREYDIVAMRGLAALRVRRPGVAPDLDGWMAGRELVLARKRIVPGRRPPKGSVLCTSAFLLRLPGNRTGGLTAAHCGGVRKDGTIHRRNAAMRRPPQPGILLGRVIRNVARTKPLDALVLPVPGGLQRPAAAIIDRGVAQPPLPVAGFARPLRGRKVCFTGSTSGVDQCGEIVGRRAAGAELLLSVFAGTVVRCTTIVGRPGDSGGPVYTEPRADGTVYAVGITTLVFGRRDVMCFTPLGPVLDTLRADLLTYTGAPAAR